MFFSIVVIFVVQITGALTKEAPVIQSFSFPEFSTIDQTVVVACAVTDGTKPLNFNWLKDGKDVDNVPNTSVHTQDRFSVLTVGPASRENVGNYTCLVRNVFGKDSFTAAFVLNEPPTWIKEPQDARVTENDFLELVCMASGHPLPKISWKKITGDSETSRIDIVNTSNMQVHMNGSLIIYNVRDDFKESYQCIASNDVGQILEKRVRVFVSGKNHHGASTMLLNLLLWILTTIVSTGGSFLSLTGQDFGVIPFSFPTHVKEGEKVFVTCTPKGEVKSVQFKWLRNKKDIKQNDRVKITDIREFSTLIINPVISEDSGNYTCTIIEDHRTASHSAELMIQGPPSWITRPSSSETVVGKNITLECSAAGRPTPSVSWKKLSGNELQSVENLSNGGKYVISNGLLTIINVQKEDQGKYTCVVSNDVGMSLEESADLLVLSKSVL
ncbi:cell adhesion molecule DSCAM-like [Argiope bruennichi]|uniref:cell adhesion molecule DSCAM-like n=1 Tax=Argiope bruennichi TaxID=94029 RepID=UPI00249430FD|nr:cell adhesion molecule DSCAM-like [Argiope bruennichi]